MHRPTFLRFRATASSRRERLHQDWGRALAILALLGVAPVFTAVAVEGQGPPRQQRERATPALPAVAYLVDKQDELSLTEAQRVALQALADEQSEAVAPLREEAQQARQSQDRGSMRAAMQALREADEEWVGKAMEVLDEDQREIATKLLEERRPRRRRPPGASN